MGKDPKPRTIRQMIEAEESRLPHGVLGRKLSGDTHKRLLQGEAELMVSEICDSILHRLNQSEQRTQSHGRLKVDSNPQ
jgi:hypothetical protein